MSEFPAGTEVFSGGRVYKVVDWGFEGTRPFLVGIDRKGDEMHLFEYEEVRVKVCGRCGGSGRYSWNRMHGSRCYGCSGVGKQILAPSAFPQKIKGVCITVWDKFGYVEGDRIDAEFCGFSTTGGTPKYAATNKRNGRGAVLLYDNITKYFQL